MQMADDFTRAHPHASNDELRAILALDLEDILGHRYKTFDDFGIGAIAPSLEMRRSVLQMDQGMRNTVLPLLDRELAMYDLSEERRSFDANYALLQPAQKQFVDQVLAAHGGAFFLDAVGGAGKTFCENLILSKFRSEGRLLSL